MRPILLATLALGACSVRPEPDPDVQAKVASAERRLAEAPSDPERVADLGQALLEARDQFRAAELLRTLVDQQPTHGRARAVLAQVYVSLGYYESGFRELRFCLDQTPEAADCLLTMGGFLRSEGSEAGQREARRLFRRFLAAAPAHPRRTEVEALVAELDAALGDDPPEAAEGVAGASPHGAAPGTSPHGAAPGASPHGAIPGASPHGAAPGAPPIPGHPAAGAGDAEVGQLNAYGRIFARAMAATRSGDGAGAEAAYREALAMRPGDPTATAGLVDALLKQGKMDEAVAEAKTQIDQHPGDPDAMWLFGTALIQSKKDVAEGVRQLEALKARNPELAAELGVDEIVRRATGK